MLLSGKFSYDFKTEKHLRGDFNHNFKLLKHIIDKVFHNFRLPLGGKFDHNFKNGGHLRWNSSCDFQILNHISRGLSHDFQTLNYLKGELFHDFKTLKSISGKVFHNFNLGNHLYGKHFHDFQYLRKVSGIIFHNFRFLNSESSSTIFIEGSGTGEPEPPTCFPFKESKFIRKIAGEFKIGENSYPIIMATIKESPSRPISWTVKINDPMGEINKNDIKPILENPKECEIKIYTGNDKDDKKAYKKLLLLHRNYEVSPQNGLSITLSGQDMGYYLYKKNQTKKTFRKKYAHSIINSIISSIGKDIICNLDFPDYPVFQMDYQQAKPIEKIQTLLNEVGAMWRMDKNKFIAWIPIKKENADFIYSNSQKNMYLCGLNEQIIDYYNKIIVCRATKDAYLAWAQEGRGNGRIPGNFKGKFWNCTFRVIESIGCRIDNVDFFIGGVDSKWAGHGYSIYGAVADSIKFNVIPNIPTNPPTPIYWKVEVRGTPDEYMDVNINLDTKYEWSEGAGDIPAQTLESNLTPNNHIARLKAEAFIRQNGRKRKKASLKSPINIFLRLDDVIVVKEEISDISGIYYPESITTTIQGCIGEQTIEVIEYEK